MNGRTVTTRFANITAQPVAQASTLVYRGSFIDENGDPILLSDLQSLTLSIAEKGTSRIINEVDEIDILNTGRGTVDSQGNLEIILQPDDIELPDDRFNVAILSLVLTWGYSGGKVGRHQVDFRVVRLAD